jgi:hypothetical protein
MKKIFTNRMRTCSLSAAFTLFSFCSVGQQGFQNFVKSSQLTETNSNVGLVGYIFNENQIGVSDVWIQLEGTTSILPQLYLSFYGTDSTGLFNFSPNTSIPLGANVKLTALKNDNHLNGVTTYDLLLISKHILGLQPLSSPYKLIAADVNKSGSVTTFDIVEARKLILGIYNEFPQNTSWRFVDKNFVFPNTLNPFSTLFPEFKVIPTLQVGIDWLFVAIKIGDINNSATNNFQIETVERKTGTFYFEVQDRLINKDETFTVNLKIQEQVLGGQFTLKYENLDLLKVLPNKGMSENNFANFPTKSALTCSFMGDDSGDFSLVFKAKKSGRLSDMLLINSEITKSEAYSLYEERFEIGIDFKEIEPNDINSNDFWSISPNPNDGNFEINAPIGTSIKVINSIGQIVTQTKISHQLKSINYKKYSAGFYVAVFQLGDKIEVKKVVIE